MNRKTTIIFFLLLSASLVRSFGCWHCNFTGVNYTYSSQDYDIWLIINEQLNSNETREFLSSFNSSYERRSLYNQLYACPYTALCEYALALPLLEWVGVDGPCCDICRCNFPDCLQDKSCCLDIIYRNANSTYQNATESIKSCVESYLSVSSLLQTDTLMYNSCPPNTAEQLRSNCTQEYSYSDIKTFKQVTPVYDIETRELYRNAYCAYCNDIVDKNIEQVKMLLFCDKTMTYHSEQDILTSVMSTGKCNISFNVMEISYEFCLITVSECNKTGQWLTYDMELELACSIYRNTILINNRAYQNIFCALCNGEELQSELNCKWPGAFEPSKSFPFSGLLKLGTIINQQQIKKSKERNCPPNHIFDNVHDTCRELLCSPFKVLNNGECSDIYKEVSNIVCVVYLKITPHQTLTVREAYSIASKVKQGVHDIHWILGTECDSKMVYKTDASLDTMSIGDVINSTFMYYIMKIDVTVRMYSDPNTLLPSVMFMDQLDILVNTRTVNETLKFKLQIIQSNSILFICLYNKSFYHNIVEMSYSETSQIPLETNIRNFAVQGDTPGLEFPHLTTCGWKSCLTKIQMFEMNVLRLKQCPQVRLSKNKLKWRDSDDGITLGGYKIKASELYYEDDNDILVCYDTYKKYLSYLNNRSNQNGLSLETIISIISTSLSIMCLIITFIVFCLLPKLRQTLPGKNNMCLACVLLCAQSMYLITGVGILHVETTACIVFGIMLHFVWLLSMFWMNVCTYHMFFVLTKLTIVTKCSWLRRFACYHLYATIMSTVPIAVNIAVSLHTSDSIGYGEVTCYISSQRMVTYTFGIPTLFVVVTNLMMFSFVMVRIKITSMVQKNVRNEQKNLVIFAKLSTLTGMTWLFGFVYSWTDHVVFSYLFILLNASQGVFFMLAFICNQRVVNMFKSDYRSHTEGK